MRISLIATIVLLVALLSLGIGESCTVQKFEKERAAVLEENVRVNALAEADKARADSLQQFAEALQQHANKQKQESDERERRLRRRVATLEGEVVPDTCAPFIAERDELLEEALDVIDQKDAVILTQRAALDYEKQRADALEQRGDRLQVANDALAKTLANVPKQRRVGLGVTVGYGVKGWDAVAGLQLRAL
jgi:DNA repair exonuclease SbcCD ATPase subunit